MSGAAAGAAAGSGNDVQAIDLYAPLAPLEEIQRSVDNGHLTTSDLNDLILRSEQILSLLREETDLLERNAAQTSASSPDGVTLPASVTTVPGTAAPGLGLLSIDERSDLVNAEFELYKQRRETTVRQAEREMLQQRAVLEDADLGSSEAKMFLTDLLREVGVPITSEELPKGPYPPPVVAAVKKFFEDQVKLQEGHIERLQSKSRTLRAALVKQDQHHRSRGELGDALQAIDFDQLKIENQQFLERMEEKNAELVKLKISTGHSVHEMNQTNESLIHLTADQQWLKKEIVAREAHLARVRSETLSVETSCAAAEKQHRALVQQHSGVRVPKVSAYIAVKVEQDALDKAVVNWKRKVEIAEGQRQVLRGQLREAAQVGLISHAELSAVGPAPRLEMPPPLPKGHILGLQTDADGFAPTDIEAGGGGKFLLPQLKDSKRTGSA